jgi:hypothetical protein
MNYHAARVIILPTIAFGLIVGITGNSDNFAGGIFHQCPVINEINIQIANLRVIMTLPAFSASGVSTQRKVSASMRERLDAHRPPWAHFGKFSGHGARAKGKAVSLSPPSNASIPAAYMRCLNAGIRVLRKA